MLSYALYLSILDKKDLITSAEINKSEAEKEFMKNQTKNAVILGILFNEVLIYQTFIHSESIFGCLN